MTEAFIKYTIAQAIYIAAPSDVTLEQFNEAKRNVEYEVLHNIYLFIGVGAAAFLAAYLLQA